MVVDVVDGMGAPHFTKPFLEASRNSVNGWNRDEMTIEPIHRETFVLMPRAGSKKLVVIFSATDNKAGKFTFWNVSKSISDNVLFVNNGNRNEWYQHGVLGLGDTAEKPVEAIRNYARLVGAESLYMVGVSMGGAGALLHGALAGAQVLAFCPETLINLPHSRCRKYMTPGTKIPYPDLSKLITPASRRIYIVSGQSDPVDIYCASTLEGIENVVVKTIIGEAHAVQVALHNQNKLIPLIRDFVNDRPVARIEGEGNYTKIPGFSYEYFRTYCSVSDRDWASAEMHGRNAIALNPTSEEVNSMLGRALMSLGRANDAYAFVAAAAALAPDDINARFAFASCLRRMGDTDRSAQLHTRLTVDAPELAKSYYELGVIYAGRKDKKNAKLHFQKAADLEPANPKYSSKINPVAEKSA